MTTFGTAFSSLQIVRGTFTFTYQTATGFTSMANAFPQLRNVTSSLNLQFNDYVTTTAGAFPRLTWVTGQMWVVRPRPSD